MRESRRQVIGDSADNPRFIETVRDPVIGSMRLWNTVADPPWKATVAPELRGNVGAAFSLCGKRPDRLRGRDPGRATQVR